MIDYFYISSKLFSEKRLKDNNHCLFIMNLFLFLKKGTFNLVIKNDFEKKFEENKKYITDNKLRNEIYLLFESHLKENKIRRISKKLDTENIEKKLLDYSTFDKIIELEDEEIKYPEQIYLDLRSLSFFINESFDQLEQGSLFNELEEIEIEKMFLGTSFVDITVFNFIDSIFKPDLKKEKKYIRGREMKLKKWNFEKESLHTSKVQIDRFILSYSLNYLCEKIINSRSNDINFLETTDEVILNINCKTNKNENFFDEHYHEVNNFLNDFVNYELKNFYFINKFIENNWMIKLNFYSTKSEDQVESKAANETHSRYIQSDNGVFSIAKDLDIYDTIDEFRTINYQVDKKKKFSRNFGNYDFAIDIPLKKKEVRFGYSSFKNPFIAMDFRSSYSYSKNIGEFFS